jgi:NADH:ubiquinone oxidoreductase subunit 5 (subunit L)/multisubunit Na+/H+ antiporter MnhA subunit
MFQSDVKRILAYSTISHCGFLMVMYTTGILEYVLLYLYIHGFFKAAVFLCIGNVIRFTRNVQDFKRMGGLWKYLPFDCLASFICLINLSGLPLTFGFYIKHIIFVGLKCNHWLYWISFSFVFLASLTGLFYSYRLFFYVFFDFKKSKKTIYFQSSRSVLNSKFFLNSSLAGMLSITGLILVSYIVSIYLFSSYLGFNNNSSDFTKVYENISYFFMKFSSYQFLFNASILNWIILSLIIMIIFTPWRSTNNYVNHYNSLYNLLAFSIFFYFFYSLI